MYIWRCKLALWNFKLFIFHMMSLVLDIILISNCTVTCMCTVLLYEYPKRRNDWLLSDLYPPYLDRYLINKKESTTCMLTLLSLIFASKRQPFHWRESFHYDFLINWAERTNALNCWPCFLLQDSHGYIGESIFLIRYVISFIFKDAIIYFGNIFCHPRISKCIPLHITMLIEA